MKQLTIMINLLLLLEINSFAQNQFQLQTGDLLFREIASGSLSQAIDEVTQTEQQTHFSHIGMVEITNDSIYVLHATPEDGTCRISLNDFLYNNENSFRITAYRLKERWKKHIPSAIKTAHTLLGKPYNFSYILTDSSHYCSEFIYRSFASDSIFELQAMTFINPATGEFSPEWITYYKKQEITIPEGLPGCNPNGMATSEKLIRLGSLK